MKKICLLATLLMASTAAHAGDSIAFQIGGHKIRIEAPKNCDKLSCLQISAPSLSGSDLSFKGFKSSRDDDEVASRADQPAQKATAPVGQATAPPPPVAAAGIAPSAPKEVASTTSAPIVSESITSVASVASPAAPTESAAPKEPGVPKETAVAAAPVHAPTTPLGVWNTEKNGGMVRIEQCGQNLCGNAVPNGEKILINMKPSGTKWTGRIHDPDSGKVYDSSIAMKGPNTLRVQGCVFGGIFCGGQTWNRVS
jgi:uncharacterized protein (DUF2147 family)